MFIAILFVFSLFAAQLLRIQALDASAMAKQALGSRLHTAVVPALRGSITDSRGVVLAASIERFDIVVNQQAVPQYVKTVQHGDTRTRDTVGVAGAAADLAPLLGMTVPEVTDKLTGNRAFNYVAKGITPLTWRKIKALGINGIDAEATSKRSYPTSTTAASLVGFVGADGRPGGGLELLLDKQLQGTPGMTSYEQSRDGRVIPTDSEHSTPAVPGRDVRLTIDTDLQWFAQNAIASQGQRDRRAVGHASSVTTSRPGSCWRSRPTRRSTPTTWPRPGDLDNQAFNDVYEPGSTGKVITASAALEEGVVDPRHARSRCPTRSTARARSSRTPRPPAPSTSRSPGSSPSPATSAPSSPARRSSRRRCTSYFTQVRPRPDVGHRLPRRGARPAGQRQGLERVPALHGAVRPGPLGQRAPGRRASSRPSPTTACACRPRWSRQHRRRQGRLHPAAAPDAGTGRLARTPPSRCATCSRASSARTAPRPRPRSPATASPARPAPPTATTPTLGGYSGKTACFIGFAPADDPEIVVGVTLQRPIKGYFGGVVAGPVFHDVMTYALQELKIPPTGTQVAPVTTIKPEDHGPASTTSRPQGRPYVPLTSPAPDQPPRAWPCGRPLRRRPTSRTGRRDRRRHRRHAWTRGPSCPATCTPPFPVPDAHGATFAADGRDRRCGGRPHRPRRVPRSWRAPAWPSRRSWSPQPRAVLGAVAALVYGSPGEHLTHGRDHRHQRQDDDGLPRRLGAPRARPRDRPGRHGRDPGRRRAGQERAHHAGGDRTCTRCSR